MFSEEKVTHMAAYLLLKKRPPYAMHKAVETPLLS